MCYLISSSRSRKAGLTCFTDDEMEPPKCVLYSCPADSEFPPFCCCPLTPQPWLYETRTSWKLSGFWNHVPGIALMMGLPGVSLTYIYAAFYSLHRTWWSQHPSVVGIVIIPILQVRMPTLTVICQQSHRQQVAEPSWECVCLSWAGEMLGLQDLLHPPAWHFLGKPFSQEL